MRRFGNSCGSARARQPVSLGSTRGNLLHFWPFLVVATLVPANASSQDLLLPTWDYQASDDASTAKRVVGETAEASYSFVNDTISDAWSITKSPLGWKAREWLAVAAVGGVTVGMIYLVDSDIRDEARKSHGFRDFGDAMRPLGNGLGLLALTGGFASTGFVLNRPKDRQTARLLMEASAVGYGFSTGLKHALGRSRPRANRGTRQFDSFGGEASMPSGETTSAFIMAGVVTSQYPTWPVQITAYSLATLVGAGRIALDGHWSSDIFLSAALGIAVSKAVVHFNREREKKRADDQESAASADRPRHLFQISTRAVRWTYVF